MTSGGPESERHRSRNASDDGPIRLPAPVCREYRRLSLYNSPYPAHDRGCAVDLYPASNRGLSPVAGEVLETRTVRAPPKPYAADEEFLILVDVDAEATGLRADRWVDEGLVARILHVRPRVSPGDVVDVGDPLGPMVRSGFFAPWVGNHVHVGFREADRNLLRAGGSLPADVAVDVDPLVWDGVGTVVETGDTYALLDAPAHPAPGDRFAAIGGRVGGEPAALDGGLTHYGGGGIPGATGTAGPDRPVTFLGHHVGDAAGRDVTWRDVDVLANGDRITGLSLFSALDAGFGAKLVCPDRGFAVGDEVRVTLRDSDDPIRLG